MECRILFQLLRNTEILIPQAKGAKNVRTLVKIAVHVYVTKTYYLYMILRTLLEVLVHIAICTQGHKEPYLFGDITFQIHAQEYEKRIEVQQKYIRYLQ